jgi:ATP-dependent 26S proteasome regulatory subunit
VLSSLLNEMDGVGGRAGGVLVIGCASRADSLDAALLRPGRFDVIIDVGLPGDQDREEIIRHR